MGMGNLGAQEGPDSTAYSVRPTKVGGVGLILLILSIATLVSAEESWTEKSALPPLNSTGTYKMAKALETKSDSAPSDYCTFSRCRPRAAHPGRDALAFGGLTLLAGFMARRPGRRRQ